MPASDLRPAVPDLAQLPPDAMMTRNQVAAVSGFALQTLKMWPAQGKGPKVTMIEGRPRYRVADVREWMGVQ
ncbi:MAG: DNA-binding protein [Rhodobacter sp.]|jgi:hypothetical protein|nr:DNA-binding protein [Rhodobacter sp.]